MPSTLKKFKVVSHMLAQRGFAAQKFDVPVYATDLQSYSIVLAKAVLNRTSPIETSAILYNWIRKAEQWRKRRSCWKDSVELDEAGINTKTWSKRGRDLCETYRPRNSPVWNSYGGYYFSPMQAIILDSLLATLPSNEPQKSACHASLVIAASKCAASPGHTAQPFKATSTGGKFLREAWLRDPIHYITNSANKVFALCAQKLGSAKVIDANVAARTLLESDLVFVDPPYSGVHYSRFYHVLETIARRECGKVSGTGRYPSPTERPASSYSRKSEAKDSFIDLIATLSERGATAIVTFPTGDCSNGISGEAVEEVCDEYFSITKKVVKTRFSTMGGNNSHRSARKLSDELILLLK